MPVYEFSVEEAFTASASFGGDNDFTPQVREDARLLSAQVDPFSRPLWHRQKPAGFRATNALARAIWATDPRASRLAAAGVFGPAGGMA